MFFMRQMQGGGSGGPMSFGRSKAKLLSEDQIQTTFADVAGVDEAKEDVQELVEFLRDPGKFQRLGGHIPRGVLMVGQPGTGKTLLAKAIAGEAKVPFFSISGSDFVEMFVGVARRGARYVRASEETGAVHHFHRRDRAVGRHRGAGLGGGQYSANRRRTNCWLRWMVSKAMTASSSLRRPTARTCLTRLCSDQGDSTVRWWLVCRIFAVGNKSPKCICARCQ